VLLAGAGVSGDDLINVEIGDRLERAAAVADPAWLTRALGSIETARRSLARNVVASLALEALFMELGTPRARAGVR
jgi:hypothetical protein